jgi:membrane associated rhomboid family serine protease
MRGTGRLWSVLVDAFRRRLTFENREGTQSLVLVILVWYSIQVGVVYLGWSVERLQWAFTTESFPQLSPGLVLAIISHDLPPNVTHILGNVAFLWLFAGESEQHMRRIEVVGFFVVTALVSVTVSTVLTGDSTLGASGGALAFVGFYGTHLYLTQWDSAELDAMDRAWREPLKLRVCWRVAIVVSPLALVGYAVGQYIGLVPAGRTDVIGHLVGVVLGVGYAVGRRWIARWCGATMASL